MTAEGVSERDVEAISAAAPEKPTAAPGGTRKILVYSACRGFRHDSIPVVSKALEILGGKTGAFEATVTDDPAAFEPGNLGTFDGVCMNNTTGEPLLPAGFKDLPDEEKDAARAREAGLRASLVEFVKSGKGLVGVHAATDCYYEWPEYGEMMGAFFWGHPWGSGDTVTIKIDEPDHPLCAAFGGKGFEVKEEMYQFKEPYSREKLRVLVTIDTEKTDMTKDGIRREDGDFAVSWVKTFGEGRVFYCSLGHNNELFHDKAILRHYLDGIQFAMGDLDVDTTPSAALGGK